MQSATISTDTPASLSHFFSCILLCSGLSFLLSSVLNHNDQPDFLLSSSEDPLLDLNKSRGGCRRKAKEKRLSLGDEPPHVVHDDTDETLPRSAAGWWPACFVHGRGSVELCRRSLFCSFCTGQLTEAAGSGCCAKGSRDSVACSTGDGGTTRVASVVCDMTDRASGTGDSVLPTKKPSRSRSAVFGLDPPRPTRPFKDFWMTGSGLSRIEGEADVSSSSS